MAPSPHRSTSPIYPILPKALSVTEHFQWLSWIGNHQGEAGGGRTWVALGCLLTWPLGLVLVQASPGHSQVQPCGTEADTNYRPFCSFKQVAKGQAQTAADIGFQEAQKQHTNLSDTNYIRAGPTNFTNCISKRRLQQALNSAEAFFFPLVYFFPLFFFKIFSFLYSFFLLLFYIFLVHFLSLLF